MTQSPRAIRWRLGIAAGCALALVALVPQFHLWTLRGRAWHGAFASVHPDETAYCTYINGLIAGRPRRSDSYAGRDDAPGAPQPESLFSIQFLPAYAVAVPARLLGISAPSAFILLAPCAAFTATLALFWLLSLLTRDDTFAATGALVILCFGALVRAQKLMQLLTGHVTPYLFMPFLRRYLPAVPFPLFFVCCALVWCALTEPRRRKRDAYALAAGLTLGSLIFSYFFLWTAAAAWLAVLALLWLAARKDERARVLRVCALIAAPALVAGALYARLLAHRAATMDDMQALTFTHAPDLLRSPGIIGLALAGLIALAARRGRLGWRTPPALFALSCALTPLVVFNQQLATGRSLQPTHYELFIANYLTLLGCVLTAALLRAARVRGQLAGAIVHESLGREQTVEADEQPRAALFPARVLCAVAAVALGWGVLEMAVAERRQAGTNYGRDTSHLVGLRLAELAHATGTTNAVPRPIVFADVGFAGKLPNIAPQAVLWVPHMISSSGMPQAEYEERMFAYLYYTGMSAAEFETTINARSYLQFWLFGWARAQYGLAAAPAPITRAETAAAARTYADFVASFDRARAARWPLTYVVVPDVLPADLSNIDLWYTRDTGERVGEFTLYRMTLRP